MKTRWVLIILAIFCVGIGAYSYVPVATAGPVNELPDKSVLFSGQEIARVITDYKDDQQVAQLVKSIFDQTPSVDECVIVKAGPRDVLVINPTAPLTPASNMKLFTAAAVLDKLGTKTKLATKLQGELGQGSVNGPLYLVGGGDPMLSTESYRNQFVDKADYTPVESLVEVLKNGGVTQIGDLVVDDTIFDDQRTIPQWGGRYAPKTVTPIGPLTLNHNAVTNLDSATNADPALFAGEAFKALLIQNGIAVSGTVIKGKVPKPTPNIGTVSSKPMSVLVSNMLRNSDNLAAETLTKYLGYLDQQNGSTKTGTEIIRNFVASNCNAVGYVQDDGSGLSTTDKATCGLLMDVYSSLPKGVRDNLAVAGQTGTLTGRLLSTPAAGVVIAKTGTLNSISSLAGQVKGRYTFAVIGNGLSGGFSAHRWQDAVAVALSAHS